MLNIKRLHLNPIIVKEMRSRMRGARPYIVLSAFLAVMIATGAVIYIWATAPARFGASVLSAQVGQALFSGLSLVEVALIVFLAPAMTSATISGEREQLTYEMLMATPLRPSQLLWGKLIAALGYIFLLIVAAIPMFSVVLLFGGVELIDVLKALAILLASTVMFGSIGVFCSALERRTARATLLSYIIILLLIAGTFAASRIWALSQTNMDQVAQAQPEWLYLNPLSAMVSIHEPPTGTVFGTSTGLIESSLIGSFLTNGIIYYGPDGVVMLPIYRATFVFYALLIVVMLWIGAHLVRPRRRWRLTRADAGYALLFVIGVSLIIFFRSWWHVVAPIP
jgi:ABC-type transport system involved in multi-copper enzyme maturation permease subunit